jgi:DNA-binding CsgD family transcriptional regulator
MFSLEDLTERQTEVINLRLAWFSAVEIADSLGITPLTVAVHMKRAKNIIWYKSIGELTANLWPQRSLPLPELIPTEWETISWLWNILAPALWEVPIEYFCIPATPKELEVFQLYTKFWTDKPVMHALGISKGTLNVHLKHLFTKLSVNSNVQLINKGQELFGWCDSDYIK